MKAMRTLSAVMLTFVVTAACADPSNGERIAQRWCFPCHVENTGNKWPAPALSAIVRNANFSREKLAVFLLLFHPKMPEISLTQKEATDLADYLAKLSGSE
jgi:cytochrome c